MNKAGVSNNPSELLLDVNFSKIQNRKVSDLKLGSFPQAVARSKNNTIILSIILTLMGFVSISHELSRGGNDLPYVGKLQLPSSLVIGQICCDWWELYFINIRTKSLTHFLYTKRAQNPRDLKVGLKNLMNEWMNEWNRLCQPKDHILSWTTFWGLHAREGQKQRQNGWSNKCNYCCSTVGCIPVMQKPEGSRPIYIFPSRQA